MILTHIKHIEDKHIDYITLYVDQDTELSNGDNATEKKSKISQEEGEILINVHDRE